MSGEFRRRAGVDEAVGRIPAATSDRPAREVRVAPNIYKTPYGWRVYVRRAGTLKPKRFKADVEFAAVQHFVEAFKLESKRLRRERRKAKASEPAAAQDFRMDAKAYLELETVKAMPSYQTRSAEIAQWVTVFGDRIRRTITTSDIDQQLQAFINEGYSGSSVNKFRTALMAMWTRLDGRSAANPVRDAMMFDEAPLVARGQAYELLTLILDSIPEERGRGVKGEKGSRKRGSESRARLEVLAWTGMDPSQLARMTTEHVSVRERWYITPPRQKGSRRRRTPRPVIQKPMSPEAARAFQRLIALGLLGKEFSTHSLRHTWERAIRRVERQLQEEYDDPDFRLPHIRLKDIRHSFGTRLFEQVAKAKKSEHAAREIVGLMLDHAPGSPMTLRYSLGAVPNVLRSHMRALPGRRRGRIPR